MLSISEENDSGDIFLDISNNINTSINNDINNDNANKDNDQIIKLQENLLMMGFEINMINNVINCFNIKTENEAIDYLIKDEDGLWNHPFYSNEGEDEILLSNVTSINNEQVSAPDNVCKICGEEKEIHKTVYQKKNNIKNEDKKNISICQICLDEITNRITIENCRHEFCRDCFENYLNNLINENNSEKIPCPEKTCDNKSLSFDSFYRYLTAEQLNKYHKNKIQNEIARDKLKIFCPLCDSYAKIDNPDKYNTNNKIYKKSKLVCQKGHEFCSCGRPFHDDDCYHESKEFKQLVTKENIKKCPKCGFLIKKNSGCNHMICGNKLCKYEFCWICMEENLPGHYDVGGPCAGKQFVNPDSIFYKLEQKYPFLSYVFTLFYILLIIMIIGIFLCFPALPLCLFTGFILYENYIAPENDEDKIFTLSLRLSVMHYIICIPILLSIQTFYYLFFALFILYLLLEGIISIFKCRITSIFIDDD